MKQKCEGLQEELDKVKENLSEEKDKVKEKTKEFKQVKTVYEKQLTESKKQLIDFKLEEDIKIMKNMEDMTLVIDSLKKLKREAEKKNKLKT